MTDTPQQPDDQQRLKTLATTLTGKCPDVLGMAREAAREILSKHKVTDKTPDQVHWHRFKGAISSTQTFTGWEHTGIRPIESMTLPQLVMHRFNLHDQDNADLLDCDGGFYSNGATSTVFDQSNEVRLRGSEVLQDLWAIDFANRYGHRLERFWHDHGTDFRTQAKATFISKALQARHDKHLSDANFQTVIKAVASNMTWPPTLAGLSAEASPPGGLHVCTLDIAGHVATDILRIVDGQGQQIVYLPNDAQAFYFLKTPRDLHWWVMSRTNTPAKRAQFMTHFLLSAQTSRDYSEAATWREMVWTPRVVIRTYQLFSGNLPADWIDNGLDTRIDQVFATWGHAESTVLNQQPQAISSDVFSWLRDSVQARTRADAEFSLHANGELRKKMAQAYLAAFFKVFGPMAIIGWPVALVVLGASLASLGLAVDQAITGKTEAERQDGINQSLLAGINVLFNATLLKINGRLPDIATASETFTATKETESVIVKPSQETPEEPLVVKDDNQQLSNDISIKPEIDGVPSSSSSVNIPASYRSTVVLDGHVPITTPGKFNQIYLLRRNPSAYIKILNHAYMVRFETDVNGPGFWAIVDPANPDAFTGSIPVRLDSNEQWQAVSRVKLAGGGKSLGKLKKGYRPMTAQPEVGTSGVTEGSPYKHLYEVDQNWIELDAQPQDSVAMEPVPGGGLSVARRPLLREIDRLKVQLRTDAKAFFKTLETTPRPQIPAFAANVNIEKFVEESLKDAPGLVISTPPGGLNSRALLKKLMPVFARQNVKTLFIKGPAAELDQAELERQASHLTMKRELEISLADIDRIQRPDSFGRDSLQSVVEDAVNEDIRVRTLDNLATSPLFVTTAEADEQTLIEAENYLASRIISAESGNGKWVALIPDTRANTYLDTPGVTELQGAISLRVEDVAKGLQTSIRQSLESTSTVLPKPPRADFIVQMEIITNEDFKAALEQSLSKKLMYRLVTKDGRPFLVHRNEVTETLEFTRVHDAPEGLYIRAEQWPDIDGRIFANRNELQAALNDKGMILAEAADAEK
ncbi:membrane-targeted effector domain-containing toxin [Pseudomonas sp. R5-89-07]|uniref:membrane-targeted effector domain-containing toxin n=1 Tax=Pseudomonas sp. R5-89-07 TaxID=658644 RepID=UPI000F567190|nr:membrane-targeted effector domain-containing toxin [Pseudomonas sp. R5-89-07]AZF07197.1 hypothetical protein C4J94_4459 [Pseudomonas sp. R5-89-07]